MNSVELIPQCLTAPRVFRNAILIQHLVAQRTGQERVSYWDAINKLQYGNIPQVHTQEVPEIIWDAGENEFQEALTIVMGLDSLPKDWQYSTNEQFMQRSRILEGLELLKDKFPDTYSALCTIVSFLLVARRHGYGGGGVSNRLGIIWLSPVESTSSEEHAENILHEFIHQALFLEDMVDPVFPFSALVMDEKPNQVLSAVRKVKRGYDKSYHSAFVAYGLVEFYAKLGKYQKAINFLAPLLPCLDELSQHPNMLSANGKRQLESLIRATLELYDKIQRKGISSTLKLEIA